MKVFKLLRRLIKRFDFFSAKTFFRYNSEHTFDSFCGGMASFVIILFLALTFGLRISHHISKTRIESSQFKTVSLDPTLTSISTYPKGNFMAAIEIPGLNLLDTKVQFFDFALWDYSFIIDEETYQFNEVFKDVYFQQCTAAHWQGFPEIANDLKLLDFSRLLCFPMGHTFYIKGKYNSFDERTFQLIVYLRDKESCSQSTKIVPRCPTPQQLSNFWQKNPNPRLQIYFINYHVTHGQQKNINYFLDNRYYSDFSKDKSSQTTIQIQDFVVKTDQSSFLDRKQSVKTGVLVEQNPNKFYFYGGNQTYAQITFAKSMSGKNYQRKPEKLQDIFSLIGGLFIVCCGLMFFVSYFNKAAYSISVGSDIFQGKLGLSQGTYENYSFFIYMQQVFRRILRKFGFHPKWKQAIQYERCQKEVKKQMNVVEIVERVRFLETALTLIQNQSHSSRDFNENGPKDSNEEQKVNLQEENQIKDPSHVEKKKDIRENMQISSLTEGNLKQQLTQNYTKLNELEGQISSPACFNQGEKLIDASKSKIISVSQVYENGFQQSFPQQPKIQGQKNMGANQKKTSISPLKCLKKFISHFDVFASGQFFRFSSKSSHQTLFGGILSITILTIILLLFLQRVFASISKMGVHVSEFKNFSSVPSLLNLKTGSEDNFMVMIEVSAFNLNHPDERYFEFALENSIKTFDQTTKKWKNQTISYDLEPCTFKHWKNFPQFKKQLMIMEFTHFLCFPIGSTFSLQGKPSSNEFRSIDIVMRKCKETDPDRVCGTNFTNYVFSDNGVSGFKVYLSNPSVNLGDLEKPSKYYLDDLTKFYMTPSRVSKASIFLEDYKIKTDNSIFPWRDEIFQKGTQKIDPHTVSSFLNTQNSEEYVRVSIMKSPVSRVYHRSYRKIEYTFAFFGGLLGIVIAILFIVGTYTHFAYQIKLSFRYFHAAQRSSKMLKSYNFLDYLLQLFYKILVLIDSDFSWNDTIEYNKYQDGAQKQLNVTNVLKKLQSLEKSVFSTLQSHQVTSLYLTEKSTLEEAKKQRKIFKIKNCVKEVKNCLKTKKKPNQANIKIALKNKNQVEVNAKGSPSELIKANDVIHDALSEPEFDERALMESLQAQEMEMCSSSDSDDSSYEYDNQERKERVVEKIKKLMGTKEKEIEERIKMAKKDNEYKADEENEYEESELSSIEHKSESEVCSSSQSAGLRSERELRKFESDLSEMVSKAFKSGNVTERQQKPEVSKKEVTSMKKQNPSGSSLSEKQNKSKFSSIASIMEKGEPSKKTISQKQSKKENIIQEEAQKIDEIKSDEAIEMESLKKVNKNRRQTPNRIVNPYMFDINEYIRDKQRQESLKYEQFEKSMKPDEKSKEKSANSQKQEMRKEIAENQQE